MSKKGEDKQWKIVEKIAGILEKFIAPNSVVQHNVLLPVIGRPERRQRQCDVVITVGSEIRSNIIIVEVQKRNRKPDITTFHGWIEKMREVGAQQLICVSALGYPQSILDEVRNKYGNTVVLMTLEEMHYLDNPHTVKLLPRMTFVSRKFNILKAGALKLERKIEEEARIETIPFDANGEIFSISGHNKKYNLTELVTVVLNNHPEYSNLEELVAHHKRIELEIEFEESINAFIFIDHEERRIKEWLITIEMFIVEEQRDVEMKQYSYRQEFTNGTIAWIASYSFDINGIEQKVDVLFNTVGGKASITIRSND